MIFKSFFEQFGKGEDIAHGRAQIMRCHGDKLFNFCADGFQLCLGVLGYPFDGDINRVPDQADDVSLCIELRRESGADNANFVFKRQFIFIFTLLSRGNRFELFLAGGGAKFGSEHLDRGFADNIVQGAARFFQGGEVVVGIDGQGAGGDVHHENRCRDTVNQFKEVVLRHASSLRFGDRHSC